MDSCITDERAALRLTSAPVAIRTAGFLPVDYRLLRQAAINGVIPAHQRNSIWHFYLDDTAKTIDALKLQRSVKAARQTIAA